MIRFGVTLVARCRQTECGFLGSGPMTFNRLNCVRATLQVRRVREPQ